jgi:hypothetical protein
MYSYTPILTFCGKDGEIKKILVWEMELRTAIGNTLHELAFRVNENARTALCCDDRALAVRLLHPVMMYE